MKRRALRGTMPSHSMCGAPCTWQRKPSSAYLSARTMPDLASRSDASTSWVLFPIDETTPIPVTTTRFIFASSAIPSASRAISQALPPRSSRPARLQHGILPEQSDLEVAGPIDHRPIGRHPSIGDAEHELRAHHPLDVDPVDHVF